MRIQDVICSLITFLIDMFVTHQQSDQFFCEKKIGQRYYTLIMCHCQQPEEIIIITKYNHIHIKQYKNLVII